jgi:hypothetical protein
VLQATFAETERCRPGRDHKSFPERLQHTKTTIDPIAKIISQCIAVCPPLRLGKQALTEDIIVSGRGVLIEMPAILAPSLSAVVTPAKRPRDAGIEEGSANKKVRREVRLKFEGEDEPDINTEIVQPENVLRMVDKSLVDTPERTTDSPFGIRFQQTLAGGHHVDVFTTPLVTKYRLEDESAPYYTTPLPHAAFARTSSNVYAPSSAW